MEPWKLNSVNKCLLSNVNNSNKYIYWRKEQQSFLQQPQKEINYNSGGKIPWNSQFRRTRKWVNSFRENQREIDFGDVSFIEMAEI